MKINSNLYSSIILIFIVLVSYRCSFNDYEINIELSNNNCTNQDLTPMDIHPVEFLWHVDEGLIYNNYQSTIHPITHSFLKPTLNGYFMRFEITEKDKYSFGQNFVLLDNCDNTWYSAKRIDDFHFELYLNNYCYDTMIDLHQRLFIVDIVFY